MSKNADPDRHCYFGYDIGFDARGSFPLLGSSGFGKNLTIFSANMSSSVHILNKMKDILILAKGTTEVLDDTMLTAVKRIF